MALQCPFNSWASLALEKLAVTGQVRMSRMGFLNNLTCSWFLPKPKASILGPNYQTGPMSSCLKFPLWALLLEYRKKSILHLKKNKIKTHRRKVSEIPILPGFGMEFISSTQISLLLEPFRIASARRPFPSAAPAWCFVSNTFRL